jgi:hypothetical protein
LKFHVSPGLNDSRLEVAEPIELPSPSKNCTVMSQSLNTESPLLVAAPLTAAIAWVVFELPVNCLAVNWEFNTVSAEPEAQEARKTRDKQPSQSGERGGIASRVFT